MTAPINTRDALIGGGGSEARRGDLVAPWRGAGLRAGVGAGVERRAEIADADPPEAAIGVLAAEGDRLTRERAKPGADVLVGVIRVGPGNATAAGEACQSGSAGQAAIAVGADGSTWALTVAALSAEIRIVQQVLALANIGAARLALGAGAAALVVGDARALALLAPPGTDACPCLANPGSTAGDAVWLRFALPPPAGAAGAAWPLAFPLPSPGLDIGEPSDREDGAEGETWRRAA